MLKFSRQNAKTKRLREIVKLQPYLHNRKIYSLDLPAGQSCPGAFECKSCVVKIAGRSKIKDGQHTKFRCFAASQEVLFPAVYNSRRYNFDILKKCRGYEQCCEMLSLSMPKNLGILRFHVSGDFFKLAYLQAAIKLADQNPDRLFYGYTKSLNFLSKIDMLDPSKGLIRPNFLITASYGGKYDGLIKSLCIRSSKVVFDEHTKLPIDHDDSHAATSGGNFALLVHGIQPKGTIAAKALSNLKGKGTYKR